MMKAVSSFHRLSQLTVFLLVFASGALYAELPPEAQAAVKKGTLAAQQQDYLLAIRYFREARNSAPDAPEIYGYLGLAESKIPGRELRAIAWFGAYLATNPNAPNAAAVQDQIDMLNIKSQSNITHLIRSLQDAAGRIPLDGTNPYPRDNALANVAALWARIGDAESAKKVIDLIPPSDFLNKQQVETNAPLAEAEFAMAVGDFARAQRAGASLPARTTDRDDVYYEIVKAQLEDGDVPAAKVTANLIQNSLKNIADLRIVEEQIRAKDIAGAQKTAEGIKNSASDDSKSKADQEIAEAQIKGGDFVGAQQTIEVLSSKDDKDRLARMLAKAQAAPPKTAGQPVPAPPVVPASEWISRLEGRLVTPERPWVGDAGTLNAPIFLDLAAYLKSLPSSDPQTLFSALDDAAFTEANAQLIIDKMLRKQANQQSQRRAAK
jgi:hypothetical protein